ncbi:MAG TPA: hypothetical protein VF531_03910 [Bacillota bacterium]
MLDLQYVRANPEEVRELCRRRKATVDLERFFDLDRKLREVTKKLDDYRHRLKELAGPENRERVLELKRETVLLEKEQQSDRAERDELWALLPNRMAPDTPEGEDDSGNVELARWGEMPRFGFDPKTHEELGAKLGILDLERGAKVAASGFYYWRGDGAKLAWAVFRLAMDFLVERGFEPFFTPLLAKKRTFFGETHSNTNLLDYQTRRLNIRCKNGTDVFHPHTISATMITDRTVLALLENNQQADGSVKIPEALRGYMNHQEQISLREDGAK